MKKHFIFFSSILLMAACVSTKVLTPTQADADRLKTKYPNLTLADLNEGKALYEKHCQSCHKLYRPNSRNEQKWNEIVPPMVKKVNRKGEVLDNRAQELILKYVVTMHDAKSAK